MIDDEAKEHNKKLKDIETEAMDLDQRLVSRFWYSSRVSEC